MRRERFVGNEQPRDTGHVTATAQDLRVRVTAVAHWRLGKFKAPKHARTAQHSTAQHSKARQGKARQGHAKQGHAQRCTAKRSIALTGSDPWLGAPPLPTPTP